MKRFLPVLVIFYSLGIILADFLKLDFWIAAGAAVILLGACGWAAKRKGAFLFVVLFLVLLIGYLHRLNWSVLPQNHIRNLVAYRSNLIYGVGGFILNEPEEKGGQLWFVLRTQEVQIDKLKYRCCGDLLVKMGFNQPLHYGESLVLLGNLSPPLSFSDRRGYGRYLARQGIYLIMPIKEERQIIRRGPVKGSLLLKGALRLRQGLEQVISRYLPDLPAGILSAMVLGQKRGVPWLVNEAMVKSGTVHILVVSGFNVGLVIFVVNLLLKILRFRRRLRIILTAACLLIYCLVTGASNPVVRATVMGLVFLTAYFFKREADIYNSLAAAGLLILAFNPLQIFDIGFQLSFVSVLAIVYLYPKLNSRVNLEAAKPGILKFIGQGCLVSLSAWLGTLPIIALNFGMISPVTVAANILIVPLATLITLCGFTLVLSGLVSLPLAQLFSYPTALLINLLLNINAALIKLPLAYIYFDKASRQW